jgi:4-amino-4-deoxy-L-arabinose transferase-like glycosyltransferase
MILVLTLAAVIYFAGLSGYPLLDPDEGRYAEIPREMLESGDFITPHLNYVKYFEKPPLFYWAVAGSMALFGQQEWAVRIVPALAGFLTVLLIMALGKRFFGMRTGVMAGWVYLTSLVPLILARLPIIDGLFSLFLTATWGTWWLGYVASSRQIKRLWFCAAWTCMGLACMTKGIAAIALTGLILFAFMIVRRDFNVLRAMAWLPGLLIFALIVLPWHLAVSSRNPEFAHFFFVVQHFGRLVSAEHSRPIWFFLVIFPFGMLLWTSLFFPAIATALKRAARAIKLPTNLRRKKDERGDLRKTTNGDQKANESEGVIFLVIWVVAVVGLFSLSRSKLVPYILPGYPAMALLIASYLTNGGLTRASARWCAGITAALLLIPIPVVSYYAKSQDMLPASALVWPVRAAQCALFFGSIMLGIATFKRKLIPAATGLVLIALMPSMIMIVPTVAKYRKVGEFIKAMPGPLPARIKIAEWRNYDQGLSFYTHRRTILVDNTGELKFGSTIGDHKEFFLQGEESLKRLGREEPLLVNIRPDDWSKVNRWGMFRPVAANSTNVMVGNEEFFQLTGLAPWPDKAVTPPPLLLLPQRLNPPGGK